MARTRKVHHTRQDHVGILRRVEHLGMSRGRGGSKAWLYVGTGLWTIRTVRRLADRREEILISEPLRPGDRLIISNARPTLDTGEPPKPPKGRRAKKKYRKAQAKAAKEQAKQDEKADKKAAKADAKMQAKIARKQAKKPKKVAPTETVVAD